MCVSVCLFVWFHSFFKILPSIVSSLLAGSPTAPVSVNVLTAHANEGITFFTGEELVHV